VKSEKHTTQTDAKTLASLKVLEDFNKKVAIGIVNDCELIKE